jgi:hypothetical protein
MWKARGVRQHCFYQPVPVSHSAPDSGGERICGEIGKVGARKRLRRPTSPPTLSKMYMHAERFRIADRILRGDDVIRQLGPSIGPPTMVLAAFASELYLKCMFILETGRSPIETHELRKLFLQLSEQTRHEIENTWNDYTSRPERIQLYETIEHARERSIPRDLRWSLRSGNDAFVGLRYAHEEQHADTIFFLGDFHIMVRAAILRRCPEWRSKVHAPAQEITVKIGEHFG